MKTTRGMLVAVCLLMIIAPCAHAVRDETLDYWCRPRWDKYIVDVNATDWDRDAVACYDKDGNEISPAKLYGAPKMYGEYEGGASKSVLKLYGPQSAPAPKKANAKKIAKPKPLKSKSVKSKPAALALIAKAESVEVPSPASIAPDCAPAAAAAARPAPDAQAQNIAKLAREKIVTEESYCTQINPAVKGPLPKGIVLMRGRPDLMNCVKN